MYALLRFWHGFRHERMAVVGLVIVGLTVVAALAAPLAPYGPTQQTAAVLAPPGAAHLLGTDNLGRDVFSRIVWGSQVSFLFGIVVAGISLLVGVALGALAGFYGGWVDDVLSRLFEIFVMIPNLFLLIVVVALFGHSLPVIMIAAGLTIWPTNARLTRAQVLTLKHRAYVDASRAAGVGDARVLLRHILPNGIHPVAANSTLQVATAIILEASLSFLGLGDPNVASWGQVLKSGQNYLVTAPWIATMSGLAIFLLVFALNVCGDGVSYALNPRFRTGAAAAPEPAATAAARPVEG